MKTITVFLFCISLLLSGCYFKQVYTGDAIVRPSTKYKYEIQFPERYYGRGNLHDPFDFHYFEGMSADWIYVNSLESRVSAKDLVFTEYWACTQFPWNMSDLEGFVVFKDGQVIVSLGRTVKENGQVRHWQHYMNGTYKLKYEDKPYVPTKDEVNNYPCDRTGVPIPQELIRKETPCDEGTQLKPQEKKNRY